MRTEKEIRDALLTIPDDETVENPCEMGHYAGYRNALEWVLEGKSNYRALLEDNHLNNAIYDIDNAIHALWPGTTNIDKVALNYITNARGILKDFLARAKERLG